MFVSTVDNQREVSSPSHFYTSLLSYANYALVISTLLMIVTILLSYPLADLLSMQLQIVAHISTIIAATVLKISYVLRCVSLNGLGREVR